MTEFRFNKCSFYLFFFPPKFIFFHRAASGDEAKTHKLLLFRSQLQQLATRLIPGEAGPPQIKLVLS